MPLKCQFGVSGPDRVLGHGPDFRLDYRIRELPALYIDWCSKSTGLSAAMY